MQLVGLSFCYVVFEILLWYVQTGNWKEAFEKVIPLRKIDKKESADISEQTSDQQTSKYGVDEQKTIKQETDEQKTCEQVCS